MKTPPKSVVMLFAGDLSSGLMTLGKTAIPLNNTKTASACIGPGDMNADGTFNLTYQESNSNRDSLLDIGANYRNVMYYDSSFLAVSGPRPALPVGEVRVSDWPVCVFQCAF